MFSASSVPISMHRACGHSEIEEVRYHSSRQRSDAVFMGSKFVCKVCDHMVRSWFESTWPPYPLELPELIGTEKRVAWARGLREAQRLKLQGVMTVAANQKTTLGFALWRAIRMYFNQSNAVFWIDGRDKAYDAYYFINEASYFLRPPTIGDVFSEQSLYGQFRKHKEWAINSVKAIPDETIAAQAPNLENDAPSD